MSRRPTPAPSNISHTPRGNGRTVVTLLLVMCAIGGLGWWGFGGKRGNGMPPTPTSTPVPPSLPASPDDAATTSPAASPTASPIAEDGTPDPEVSDTPVAKPSPPHKPHKKAARKPVAPASNVGVTEGHEGD